MGSCDVIRRFFSLARLAIMASVVTLCALLGCGGGTTGSGDAPSVKVYGSVTDPQGQPVSSGSVSDLNGDATTQINTSGAFEITAKSADGTVSLDVTANGTSGTIQVKNVPSSAQSVTIKVIVDSVSGIVSLASVEIESTSASNPDGAISQSVRGTITGSTGNPAKNVTVSIGGSRFTDVTDAQGKFTLSGRSTDGTLTIRLQYKGLDGEAVIRGVPTDRNCTLRVRISISIEAGQNPGEGGDDGSSLSVDVDGVSVS